MIARIALNSHGLWSHTATPAPETGPLTQDMAVDIAVIGAGYTGLSTALHLAEGGATSVAVLEAADIGYGASGRNAGMVNAGAWIAPDELPRRLGDKYGRRLLHTLGDGPAVVFDTIRRHGIDCHAAQNGNLHCAIGAQGLADIRERARQWASHGVTVHLLDASKTAALVGTDAYSGALLDPRTGTIQPLSYVRGLARVALGLGVQLHTHTSVVAAHRSSHGWELATSHGHRVRARQIVVATNTLQGPGPDAWPQLQSELVRLPYFNVATEPLPADIRARILPQGRGAWDTATILSSYRLDTDGRLVYGSVGAVGTGTQDAHVQWTRRAIARLFPELHDIGIQYQWHGWIDATAHHLPYLHQLAPDVWSVSGYNGRGIGPGTILGRELAHLLLGQQGPQDMPLPVTSIQPIRLKRLRELFYAKASVAAHTFTKRL